jgi:hypothetical protein
MQIRSGSVERFAARIDDDGPLGAQLIEVQADGLADAPFDAVAQHCFAECAGGGEPDVRSARLRFAYTERREQGTGETGSVVIDASEIFRSEQAYTFGKTGDEILPLGTDSEFLAAPGPAPRQHRAAILGLHAAAETMRFRTVTIIRLKGTFRHFSSSIQYRSAGAGAANWAVPGVLGVLGVLGAVGAFGALGALGRQWSGPPAQCH